MKTHTCETSMSELDAATAVRSLSLPWPSVHAPYRYDLSLHAQRWAKRFRLVPTDALRSKLRAVDVGGLAALTYPGARMAVQRVLAEFFAWIFLQDDFFDEADRAHDPERLERTLRTYVAVLGGVEPPPDIPAPVAALADLRTKLFNLGGASWFARFGSSMRRFWLDGVLEESRHHAGRITPSLARYHVIRLESVGAYPVLDLIEAVYDPRSRRRSSTIRSSTTGNAYVTEVATSADFPTTPGAFDPTFQGSDAFVTKLNPADSALVYSTYLGGSPDAGWITGQCIHVDGGASLMDTVFPLEIQRLEVRSN